MEKLASICPISGDAKRFHPGQGIGLSNNYDVGEEDGAEDIHLTYQI
ncbi:MAG: hypothetical protein WDO19_14985 [Bacteroidota bacterium]